MSSSLSVRISAKSLGASSRSLSASCSRGVATRCQFQSRITSQSPRCLSTHSSNVPLSHHRTIVTQVPRPSKPPSSAPIADPSLPLSNLPYFVRRTPSNQLPVYLVTKAGGTKQETKIQKTEGDVDALRSDLARALGLEKPGQKKSSDVAINRLNGHILVKGWRKPEIQKFLLDRKF